MKIFQRLLAAGAAVAVMMSATMASANGHGGASPWNGFYLGGHLGYGTDRGGDMAVDGVVGGLHGGYNWTRGHMLIGVEADFTFSGMDAKFSETVPGGACIALVCAPVTINGEVKVDWLWSIRARLGFLATKDMLIYGTLGYGGFKVSASATDGIDTFSMSARANGIVAGGGLEYAFSNNLLARIEGLHYVGNNSDIDADVTVVRGGLSFRF